MKKLVLVLLFSLVLSFSVAASFHDFRGSIAKPCSDDLDCSEGFSCQDFSGGAFAKTCRPAVLESNSLFLVLPHNYCADDKTILRFTGEDPFIEDHWSGVIGDSGQEVLTFSVGNPPSDLEFPLDYALCLNHERVGDDFDFSDASQVGPRNGDANQFGFLDSSSGKMSYYAQAGGSYDAELEYGSLACDAIHSQDGSCGDNLLLGLEHCAFEITTTFGSQGGSFFFPCGYHDSNDDYFSVCCSETCGTEVCGFDEICEAGSCVPFAVEGGVSLGSCETANVDSSGEFCAFGCNVASGECFPVPIGADGDSGEGDGSGDGGDSDGDSGEGDGSGDGGDSDGDTGDEVDGPVSCESLYGIECSLETGGICNGLLEETFDTLGCCVPGPNQDGSSCTQDLFLATRGGVVTEEQFQCGDDDGDGIGFQTIKITTPADQPFVQEELDLLEDIPEDYVLREGDTILEYQVECYSDLITRSRRTTSFVSLFSLLLFASLLIVYYWRKV